MVLFGNIFLIYFNFTAKKTKVGVWQTNAHEEVVVDLPNSIWRDLVRSFEVSRACSHYTVQDILGPGSDCAQVERRRVNFLDQTMSRGEVFGLKKNIKIIHC